MTRMPCSTTSRLTQTLGCLFLTAALIGCGGGGGGRAKKSSRGQLRFNVAWPIQQGRTIPANAQSILVQLKQGTTVVESELIVRPATTVSFPNLPVGWLTVTASAYASVDGSGTMLAKANVPANVLANQTTAVDVNLASTIHHLEATPNPFVVGAGYTNTLNVVARDEDGAVVLVDPTMLTYASSNPGVVTIDANGLATAGLTPGTATITVTEWEGSKTLSVPVSVVRPVTITSAASSVAPGGYLDFDAKVVGPANPAVIWSVQEGAAGGTIDSAGLYHAPNVRGTYHIVATLVSDPTQTATFAVTVASGGATVIVH